jgi:CheY-like chemotaxis protein
VPVVLVVEHEEPLQEIVHDALKEGDFDLTTVASGREAVAMIESGVVKYSALVADVNLKGPMKGWEIARLARQIDPAFPIVYMTGVAAADWRSEGAQRWRPCQSIAPTEASHERLVVLRRRILCPSRLLDLDRSTLW